MQNNKHRNCLQVLFLLIFTAFVTAGCTKEDISQCNTSHKFTLKASDADNGDITNPDVVKEIKLYVFDDAKNYLETHNTTIGEVVELNYPHLDKLHIVAWGNLDGGKQKVPTINIGDNLETAFISLHTTKASLPIAQSPDDLFHQDIEVTKEERKVDNVLTMRRATSSVAITTRKLKEYASVDDDDFSYTLRETTDKLDFYGKPSGTEVVHYRPDAAFDNTGQFVSPIFNILPTTTDIEIDIYHGSDLVASIKDDGKGNPLKAVEGKLLNVLIDFSLSITVKVEVTQWGEQKVWKNFN